MSAKAPELSIVVPLFNEEDSLPLLVPRLVAVLADFDYEVLLVDDGSTDQTAARAAQFCAENRRLKLLRLSRNFGHQPAIYAGLQQAKGRGVVVMDGDLQDPPEVIPAFVAAWKEGFEVVYGVREDREEILPLRIAYKAFYRLLAMISSIEIPLDSGDFSLMDRRIVDLLNKMPEQCRFMRGLRAWVGFRQKGIPFKRQRRTTGKPKYSLSMLFRLAYNGIFSFSQLPLILLSRIGFLVALGSFLAILSIVAIRLTTEWSIPGFAALSSILFFLGGIQMLSIGILGEYVGRIFDEVKQRPRFIIASTENIEESGG